MYAVLQIPRLALQAVLTMEARDPAEGSRSRSCLPVAVVDAEAKKPVVLEITEAAERESVVVGLSIPQALARCEGLKVRHRSEQAERMLEELLFSLAYTLSPRVEQNGMGEFLVDLRGVKREVALRRCEEIVGEMAAKNLKAGAGVAESCVVAGLAARVAESGVLVVESRNELGRDIDVKDSRASSLLRFVDAADFLGSLPLGSMEMSEGLGDVLGKWGVRTLGAFAKLERPAVGARLGVEGLRLWDRVTGREARVVGVAELPLDFCESWEFEYDVDSVEPLLFLARRFFDTLSARMQAAHKVATLIRVELSLAYGKPLALEQKLPEPTRDEGALFRLLTGRLEGLEVESPVRSMELKLEVEDFRDRQFGLFESSLKNPYRFAQTLAKVAGIVGAERVGRPVLPEDGRPDGARLEELPASVSPMAGGVSLKNDYGMPLRRFRPRMPAAVEFQGRQPIWVKCERVSGFVKTVRGPWLHSGHWWEETGSWNRVEWDVELNKGGVYRISKDEEGWKLDGCYG